MTPDFADQEAERIIKHLKIEGVKYAIPIIAEALRAAQSHGETIGIDCEITDHNHALLVKERDQLKARVERLTSALERIMNYPETFVTSPEGHMRVIAKLALAEQEGK